MKKTIYLLLALLTATPSMATENNSTFFSRILVSIGLSVLVSKKAKRDVGQERSLELHDLDEKQVLDLILNNYLRKAKAKKHIPNELRGLIYKFFIDEWTIHGLNKNTGTAYDPHGFDISGIHKETKSDLDPKGFRQNGYYKNVTPTTGKPTKYDPQGYDIDRWHKDGLHENGHRVDDNGFAEDVGYANIALYQAIENVDIRSIKLVLKHPNINVNLKKYGLAPLIWCCIEGDTLLGIAKSLLEHPNIDIDVKDINGNTPLIWCCIEGDKSLGIAKSLLEHPNIDIEVKDINGNTPLDTIIRWGVFYNHKNCPYVNLWNMLIAKGAILDQYKAEYHNLNPSDFEEPQRNYVRLIKQNPPRNCINTKFIESQQ